MVTAKKRVVIEQDPDAPVEKRVLAKAIVDISAAGRALAASGLNRRAIVVLIAHSSKQPQNVIKDVLDSIETLARDYTR